MTRDEAKAEAEKIKEESVKFAHWICKQGYDSIQIAVSPRWRRTQFSNEFTTDQLYDQYLESNPS